MLKLTRTYNQKKAKKKKKRKLATDKLFDVKLTWICQQKEKKKLSIKNAVCLYSVQLLNFQM